MMQSRIRTFMALVFAAASFAVRAPAQSHPTLAGVWVLDPAKTTVDGQAPAPTAGIRTITQHGDTLTVDNEVTSDAGAQKSHLVWGLDGKPWKNMVPVNGESVEVTSVLSWEGATLVVRTTLTYMDTDVLQVDKWTVSADGKSLTGTRTVSAMGQDVGTITTTYMKKP